MLTSVVYDIGQMAQIDVLSDDVLLGVFDFHTNSHPPLAQGDKSEIETWQTLVHVCRRWRTLVLGSPRRLNLQLLCRPRTPAQDKLDIWPTLPLVVYGDVILPRYVDNVIAVLGQSNRIREITFFDFNYPKLQEVLDAMEVPFPELTYLSLSSYADSENPTFTPFPGDSFLGGSAPCLRYLELVCIPFPTLPELQLSADHLAELHLCDIPRSGYISPEAMATLLSVLSGLRSLTLKFEFPEIPQYRIGWESQGLPPPKRSILPSLNFFIFKGAIEYLESLLTFIDAPQVNYFYLTFFNDINFVPFDCQRLAQFIDCTPTLKAVEEAHVQFDDDTAAVKLRYRTSTSIPFGFAIEFLHSDLNAQHSNIGYVCACSLPTISTLEDLYIEHEYSQRVWKDYAIDNNTRWLELFLPSTLVKDLYLSKDFAPIIATVLQEFVERSITGVLPSLQNIFVEGLEPSRAFEENVGQFVAARQLSDRPIAISVWDKDYTGNWKATPE